MISSRRSFLLGASSFLAAPAIVRVANLMPVSVIDAPCRSVSIKYEFDDIVSAFGTASPTWWKAVMIEGADWLQIAVRDGKPIWTRTAIVQMQQTL